MEAMELFDSIDAIPGFVPWFVLQKKGMLVKRVWNFATRVSGVIVPKTWMT